MFTFYYYKQTSSGKVTDDPNWLGEMITLTVIERVTHLFHAMDFYEVV